MDKIDDIRTDMWNEMTSGQLTEQQNLIVIKISLLHKFLSTGYNPTAQTLYVALETALADITNLITHKHEQYNK